MDFALMVVPLFLFIGIGGLALRIWMLVDCAMNEPSEGNDKRAVP